MATEGARIIVFCSVHHEAEEGGEAVQGGVEELSTGLPASATICLHLINCLSVFSLAVEKKRLQLESVQLFLC